MIFKFVYLHHQILQNILHLHSNLVIFKLQLLLEYPKSYITFTFQSGDIQIGIGMYNHVGIYAFTFQSGDIQIIFRSALFTWYKSIYIPIWWYSNTLADLNNILFEQKFTFQSGDIQMPDGTYHQWQNSNLHSNLVIFKYNIIVESNSQFEFTFQSGDIQIRT